MLLHVILGHAKVNHGLEGLRVNLLATFLLFVQIGYLSYIVDYVDVVVYCLVLLLRGAEEWVLLGFRRAGVPSGGGLVLSVALTAGV